MRNKSLIIKFTDYNKQDLEDSISNIPEIDDSIISYSIENSSPEIRLLLNIVIRALCDLKGQGLVTRISNQRERDAMQKDARVWLFNDFNKDSDEGTLIWVASLVAEDPELFIKAVRNVAKKIIRINTQKQKKSCDLS